MGCNCNKAKQDFKNLVQQAKPVLPPSPTPPPITRAEKIRLRGIRIEARNQRMAARNASALAIKQAEDARKNLGNQ